MVCLSATGKNICSISQGAQKINKSVSCARSVLHLQPTVVGRVRQAGSPIPKGPHGTSRLHQTPAIFKNKRALLFLSPQTYFTLQWERKPNAETNLGRHANRPCGSNPLKRDKVKTTEVSAFTVSQYKEQHDRVRRSVRFACQH